MTAWNDLVLSIYKENKKNPNYKLKDAMMDAKKVYKKKKSTTNSSLFYTPPTSKEEKYYTPKLKKLKRKRCKNGTRKNKKTLNCDKK